MILTSSVHSAATSTECSDEVALLNSNECCEDNFEAETKELAETTWSSSINHHILIVGAICMACIVGLLVSAFIVEPSPETSTDCDVAVTLETSQTVFAFVLGWAVCYIGKRQQEVMRMISSAPQLSTLFRSSSRSLVSAATGHCRSLRAWFSNQGLEICKQFGLAMVGFMCIGCICALVMSAFTAVPDEEAPTDDGFASESSQTMKAFTVGWMFLLSFKLRRELVGLVGSSCALQPF